MTCMNVRIWMGNVRTRRRSEDRAHVEDSSSGLILRVFLLSSRFFLPTFPLTLPMTSGDASRPEYRKCSTKEGSNRLPTEYSQNSTNTYSLSLMTLSKLSLLITKIPSSISTLARHTVTRHTTAKPNPPMNLMMIYLFLSFFSGLARSFVLSLLLELRCVRFAEEDDGYDGNDTSKKTGRRRTVHRPRGTRVE